MPVKVSASFEAAPVVFAAPAPPAPLPPVAHAGSPVEVVKSAATVKNYRDGYVLSDLKVSLQYAIQQQMDISPENFAADIVAGYSSKYRYAKEFADHFADKLAAEQVKVLNETTVLAMSYLRRNYNSSIGRGLRALYEFMYKGGKPEHSASGTTTGSPAPATNPNIAAVRKFAGC